MANFNELQVAVDKFVDYTEPKAREILEGDENTDVTTDAGTVPSYRKHQRIIEEEWGVDGVLATVGGLKTDAETAATAATAAQVLAETAQGLAETARDETIAIKDTIFTANVYAVDFGVTADGSTDDTDALQDAIDAAVALRDASGCGVRVILPSGVIRLNRTSQTGVGNPGDSDKHSILLYSNISLSGQGLQNTVLRPLLACPDNTPILLAHDADTSGTNPLGASGSANIVVEDLTIDGYADERVLAYGGENEGINFKDGTACIVRRCEIYNTGQDGVDLDGGTDISIYDCYIHDTNGNGVHVAGSGPTRTRISRTRFFNCGHLRAANQADSGAAIDATLGQENTVVTDCIFSTNARAILCQGGNFIVCNCSISHSTDDYPPIYLLTGSSSAFFRMTNSSISWSNNTSSCIIKNAFNKVKFTNNVFNHASSSQACITATSAGAIDFVENTVINCTYVLHLVSAASGCTFSRNRLLSYTNALRVEAAVNGTAKDNLFLNTGGSNSHIQWRSGSSGWIVESNFFAVGPYALNNVSGGGASTIYRNNRGYARYTLAAGGCKLIGNEIGTFEIKTGAATGNLFENNDISSVPAHTTATYASNTWRNNTGATVSGYFKGTATLVSGTVTVNSAAVHSASRIMIYRQSVGASTGIGTIAIGTITTGASFTINSLDSTGAIETGDISVVKWEIVD